jgi:hypothetical protein
MLVAVMAAGWWGLKRAMWYTPTGHEITRVVRGAVSVNEDLLTPPQAYRNVRITPREMARLSERAQRTLADYYTGSPLQSWKAIARRVLSPEDLHHGKTSAWMTAWRVDWIHLGELTLGPRRATATASAELRSNGGAVDRLDYTYDLVKTGAGWRINAEDFQFEGGSGP